MGANIGTSVTNTIVSVEQITKKNVFRRAFSGATYGTRQFLVMPKLALKSGPPTARQWYAIWNGVSLAGRWWPDDVHVF